MERNVKISNDNITAEISLFGAELKSIKVGGVEKLWQGDEKFWNRSSPILFPICGSLKDETYFYNGKEYHLKQHGFAGDSDFELEFADGNKAVFLLRSDEKTIKNYPFEFEFRVIYELLENGIKTVYEARNLSDSDMYFSVGAHEGWSTPGGIQNYTIEFENDEELLHTVLDGTLITHEKVKVGKGKLKLNYDYFSDDALVFLDLTSQSLILKNDKTGEKLKVEFKDCSALLLWTVENAEFICIEPWCGMPDYNDTDGDFKNKAGIIKVESKNVCEREHTVRFFN